MRLPVIGGGRSDLEVYLFPVEEPQQQPADGDVPRRENHGGRLGREFRSQPAEEELRGVAHADDPLDHVNRDRIDADDLEEIGPPPPLAHIYYIIEQREHAQRVGSGGEYEGRSPELLVDRL